MTRHAHGRYSRLRSGYMCAAMSAALAAGCGGAKPGEDSQVAAHVNKGEISVHQVQHVLQSQTRLFMERPELAARKALDTLVEQELAAQAARNDGLDHAPAVVQAMQVAQREVLARAYQDRLAAKAVGPSSDEIDRFYESQPALFKERRLYMLQEFAVEATALQFDGIDKLVGKAASAGELEELLRTSGRRFETRQFVQAAEDLPFGLLGPMSRLKEGQSMAIRQPHGARVFTLLYARPAPVDRRTASDAITAYLASERRRKQTAQGMKDLRDAARIEYVGSFSQTVAAAASAPSPN